MKVLPLFFAALVALSSCNENGSNGDSEGTDSTATSNINLESGVQVSIERPGDGILPQMGQRLTVHYKGMLDDGTVFDESYQRGQPFTFQLGVGQVIPGWEQGMGQLSKGAKASIFIPSDLAYGPNGAGGVIPPNANLTFEVEILNIEDGPKPIPHDLWSTDGVKKNVTESGLTYYIIEEGAGEPAMLGKNVRVHYYGALEDGTKFDSSFERGEPIEFQLGSGRVIPGWEEGISLLSVGTKAQLVIPSNLAYGEGGAGGVIPPNATLIFDVELIEVF